MTERMSQVSKDRLALAILVVAAVLVMPVRCTRKLDPGICNRYDSLKIPVEKNFTEEYIKGKKQIDFSFIRTYLI